MCCVGVICCVLFDVCSVCVLLWVMCCVVCVVGSVSVVCVMLRVVCCVMCVGC